MAQDLVLGIPLYPHFDSLDVFGPYQVFTFLPGVRPVLIGEGTEEVSIEGVTVKTQATFADAPELDLIFVPGTNGGATAAALGNRALLDFVGRRGRAIRQRAGDGRTHLVTSVCSGALILATCGLLDRYQATTHWLYQDALAVFPQVRVAPGYPRFVIDRDVVTGGGISSGIDEALAIASIIAGDEAAQRVQLTMQYAPDPPFRSGDPTQASPRLTQSVAGGSASDTQKLIDKAREIVDRG